MASVEYGIEVGVPVRTAYNQWTQFEEFPGFMEGVKSVTQVDDKHLHWVAEIAGVEREWDAEITEQIPDERIAWRSTSGPTNAGVVTFHHLEEGRSKVMLQMEVEADDAAAKVADFLGIVERKTKGDLVRFKEHIESRGTESGAWRGEIEQEKKAG